MILKRPLEKTLLAVTGENLSHDFMRLLFSSIYYRFLHVSLLLKMKSKRSTDRQRSKLVILNVFSVILTLAVVLYFQLNPSTPGTSNNQLKLWPITLNQHYPSDQLRTVKKISDVLGHRLVNGTNEEWDVMWSFEFPFDNFPEKLVGLKPHQLINHFPGITFLTNKM